MPEGLIPNTSSRSQRLSPKDTGSPLHSHLFRAADSVKWALLSTLYKLNPKALKPNILNPNILSLDTPKTPKPSANSSSPARILCLLKLLHNLHMGCFFLLGSLLGFRV